MTKNRTICCNLSQSSPVSIDRLELLRPYVSRRKLFLKRHSGNVRHNSCEGLNTVSVSFWIDVCQESITSVIGSYACVMVLTQDISM